MAANKFVLKGSGVEVDYTIGANPVFPALVYTDGAFQKKFKPSEILSENTGLGEMVSVALILTIDAGGERFLILRGLGVLVSECLPAFKPRTFLALRDRQ